MWKNENKQKEAGIGPFFKRRERGREFPLFKKMIRVQITLVYNVFVKMMFKSYENKEQKGQR